MAPMRHKQLEELHLLLGTPRNVCLTEQLPYLDELTIHLMRACSSHKRECAIERCQVIIDSSGLLLTNLDCAFSSIILLATVYPDVALHLSLRAAKTLPVLKSKCLSSPTLWRMFFSILHRIWQNHPHKSACRRYFRTDFHIFITFFLPFMSRNVRNELCFWRSALEYCISNGPMPSNPTFVQLHNGVYGNLYGETKLIQIPLLNDDCVECRFYSKVMIVGDRIFTVRPEMDGLDVGSISSGKYRLLESISLHTIVRNILANDKVNFVEKIRQQAHDDSNVDNSRYEYLSSTIIGVNDSIIYINTSFSCDCDENCRKVFVTFFVEVRDICLDSYYGCSAEKLDESEENEYGECFSAMMNDLPKISDERGSIFRSVRFSLIRWLSGGDRFVKWSLFDDPLCPCIITNDIKCMYGQTDDRQKFLMNAGRHYLRTETGSSYYEFGERWFNHALLVSPDRKSAKPARLVFPNCRCRCYCVKNAQLFSSAGVGACVCVSTRLPSIVGGYGRRQYENMMGIDISKDHKTPCTFSTRISLSAKEWQTFELRYEMRNGLYAERRSSTEWCCFCYAIRRYRSDYDPYTSDNRLLSDAEKQANCEALDDKVNDVLCSDRVRLKDVFWCCVSNQRMLVANAERDVDTKCGSMITSLVSLAMSLEDTEYKEDEYEDSSEEEYWQSRYRDEYECWEERIEGSLAKLVDARPVQLCPYPAKLVWRHTGGFTFVSVRRPVWGRFEYHEFQFDSSSSSSSVADEVGCSYDVVDLVATSFKEVLLKPSTLVDARIGRNEDRENFLRLDFLYCQRLAELSTVFAMTFSTEDSPWDDCSLFRQAINSNGAKILTIFQPCGASVMRKVVEYLEKWDCQETIEAQFFDVVCSNEQRKRLVAECICYMMFLGVAEPLYVFEQFILSKWPFTISDIIEIAHATDSPAFLSYCRLHTCFSLADLVTRDIVDFGLFHGGLEDYNIDELFDAFKTEAISNSNQCIPKENENHEKNDEVILTVKNTFHCGCKDFFQNGCTVSTEFSLCDQLQQYVTAISKPEIAAVVSTAKKTRRNKRRSTTSTSNEVTSPTKPIDTNTSSTLLPTLDTNTIKTPIVADGDDTNTEDMTPKEVFSAGDFPDLSQLSIKRTPKRTKLVSNYDPTVEQSRGKTWNSNATPESVNGLQDVMQQQANEERRLASYRKHNRDSIPMEALQREEQAIAELRQYYVESYLRDGDDTARVKVARVDYDERAALAAAGGDAQVTMIHADDVVRERSTKKQYSSMVGSRTRENSSCAEKLE